MPLWHRVVRGRKPYLGEANRECGDIQDQEQDQNRERDRDMPALEPRRRSRRGWAREGERRETSAELELNQEGRVLKKSGQCLERRIDSTGLGLGVAKEELGRGPQLAR